MFLQNISFHRDAFFLHQKVGQIIGVCLASSTLRSPPSFLENPGKTAKILPAPFDLYGNGQLSTNQQQRGREVKKRGNR
ncbi:hypothetical protein D5086_033074 [Populus alba]|uniref:Uncharacterized protein n=1 Tax=Populus alba TaxID=43335 RepID=A0ACC4AFT0_POPAL